MVIVDDGYETRAKIRLYCQLARRGHVCEWLPFNSDFASRTNAAVQFLDRPYTLVASDDLNFAGEGVGAGILQMVAALEADPEVGAIRGCVDNKAYDDFILLRTGLVGAGPLDDIPWCPGVNVNRQHDTAAQARNHPAYRKYRGRAR
jgi:hypothetical protein